MFTVVLAPKERVKWPPVAGDGHGLLGIGGGQLARIADHRWLRLATLGVLESHRPRAAGTARHGDVAAADNRLQGGLHVGRRRVEGNRGRHPAGQGEGESARAGRHRHRLLGVPAAQPQHVGADRAAAGAELSLRFTSNLNYEHGSFSSETALAAHGGAVLSRRSALRLAAFSSAPALGSAERSGTPRAAGSPPPVPPPPFSIP